MPQFIDLRPTPRLLGMLGRIPLKGWQCVAELIDNSLDSMIQESQPDEKGEIKITLPSAGDIDNNIPLIVQDNGTGMNQEQLKNALTAGISGKTDDSDLGLFGMGFNIATARIGKDTTVWTSTKDSDHDVGVKIDLIEMSKSGSFKRELLSRKGSPTSEIGNHGTIIEINNYVDEANRLIVRPELIRRLQSVYSSSIRDKYNIDIKCTDHSGWTNVSTKRFCMWNKDRQVFSPHGEVPAYIEIDNHVICEKLFCSKCLIELGNPDEKSTISCPECNSSETVITKKYEVSGWVGIQRYFHDTDYGLDIVRNGRIIKEWDKSLFTWYDRYEETNQESLFEYPIDNRQLGGRIIGEIHANFILPEFTKDNFQVTEEWLDVVEIVRGRKPLQPQWATKKLGLGGKNRSPLAMLFYGFRKTEPGRKYLVCGAREGRANAGNRLSLDYSRKFFDGEEDYQTDEKWYDLVMLAEEGDDTSDGGDSIPGGGTDTPDEDGSTLTEERYKGAKELLQEKVFDLSDTTGMPAITTRIYKFTPLEEYNPIILEHEAPNSFIVYINQRHAMLRDFPEGWEDLLLMEISQRIIDRITDRETWTITKIYYDLKSKYYKERLLITDTIVLQSKKLMRDLLSFLVDGEFELKPRPSLRPTFLDRLKQDYARIEGKELRKPSQILRNTGFLRYMETNYLFEFIESYPNLIFDGNFVNLPYEEFSDPFIKESELKEHLSLFSSIAWINENLGDFSEDRIKREKSKILLAKLNLEYLTERRS